MNVVTLLLTGRATPYLHNGVVYVGDEDHYAMPQFGILGRAVIGLLAVGSDSEMAMMVQLEKYIRSRTLPRLLELSLLLFSIADILETAGFTSKDARISRLGDMLQ